MPEQLRQMSLTLWQSNKYECNISLDVGYWMPLVIHNTPKYPITTNMWRGDATVFKTHYTLDNRHTFPQPITYLKQIPTNYHHFIHSSMFNGIYVHKISLHKIIYGYESSDRLVFWNWNWTCTPTLVILNWINSN